MRFAAIFFAVFITLTMTIVMSEKSHEMFAYAFYANLYYLVLGGIGWYLTDRFIGTGNLSRTLVSILFGLVILNLTAHSVDRQGFLTPALFATSNTSSSFAINLGIHIVFLISFLASYFDKRGHRQSAEE
jgi:hypothetical protein